MTILYDTLLLLGLVIFFASAMLVGWYGLHMLYLTIRAKLRPQATPLRDIMTELAADELPEVTLQIPTCNEGETVLNALRSAVALDYPKDKLQIQICDDSSDQGTSDICATFATEHSAKGFRIEHIQRNPRTGFKPGNLNHAMKTATGEFIMILDADFRAPEDFLRRNLPFFYDDAKLAAVQSYWTHDNREANILTQSIEYSYDLHLLIEQLTWSNWKNWMQFNGSGGIWRRSVIDEFGGWPEGIGTEDVYMSYLVQPKGWRILFSTATTCLGQLPSNITSYRNQQGRWALCCGEVWRVVVGKILSSGASLSNKEQTVGKIGGYWCHTGITGLMIGVLPTVLFLQRHPSLMWLLWPAMIMVGLLLIGNGVAASEASHRAGRGFWGTQWSTLLLGFQQSGIAPLLANRFIKGLLGGRLRQWLPSNARGKGPGFLRDVLFELALLAGVVAACVVAIQSGSWLWLACIPAVTFSLGVVFVLACPWIVKLPAPQIDKNLLPDPTQKKYSPAVTAAQTTSAHTA